MSLFKPAWQNPDERKAIQALEKMTDPNMLMEIILSESKKTDKWYSRTGCAYRVRLAAVRKITDEELLKTITRHNTHIDVQKTALLQIHDNSFLINYARDSKHHLLLRTCAISQLEAEEDVLLDFALNSGDGTIRRCAAQRLTKQENIVKVLQKIRIYKEDERLFVLEMFKRLDEAARFHICVRTQDNAVRACGEGMLSDNDLLVELARQTGCFSMKNADILRKLSPEELYLCYKQSYDYEKIMRVLDELKDSVLLLKIADDFSLSLKEFKQEVINKAVKQIADPVLIERTVLERHSQFKINETSIVLEALLEKVDNQNILAQIAKNTNVSSLCRVLARKLNDTDLLCDVAKNCQSLKLFDYLIPSINDPMLLAHIVCKEKDPVVIGGYSSYTTSIDLDEPIRWSAQERLLAIPNNTQALDYIAKTKNSVN